MVFPCDYFSNYTTNKLLGCLSLHLLVLFCFALTTKVLDAPEQDIISAEAMHLLLLLLCYCPFDTRQVPMYEAQQVPQQQVLPIRGGAIAHTSPLQQVAEHP